MQYIPSHILQQIREAIDIVDLIGEYVVLKQRGRNFIGLCPFHTEKTPSFTVNPEKQIFYCFGCGAGGDVFAFIMKHERLEFPEAVQMLADRSGLRWAAEQKHRPEQSEQAKKIFQLNLLAARFFYQALATEQGKLAAAYLRERGLTPAIRKSFAVGFAYDSWDSLLKKLQAEGFKPEEIVKAGLAVAKENGSYYDRFRNRVMFPIQDNKGRFIAFGGRTIDGGEPKYLNSPETPVFQKKMHLYALKQALAEIRRTGTVLIMEGYMDVIAAHQYGFTNAVASLGTSFTREQARLLTRYAREAIIAYDSDNAGIKAAQRCIEVFDGLEMVVRVLEIPEGKDPDDFLRKWGREAFQKLLLEAGTAIEYKLKLGMKQYDTGTVQGKVDLVRQLLPDIAKLKGSVERQEYIKLIARKLNLHEEALYHELQQEYKIQNYTPAGDKNTRIRNNIQGSSYLSAPKAVKAELDLLKLVLEQPELVFLVDKEIGYANFTDPRISNILPAMKKALLETGEELDIVRLLEYMPSGEEKQLVLNLTATDPIPVNEKSIADSIKAMNLGRLKTMESQKRLEISQAEKEGNFAKVHELTLLLVDLQKQIQSLK